MHKIHRPDFVQFSWRRRWNTQLCDHTTTTFRLRSGIEILLSINTVNSVFPEFKTFAKKQNVKPSISIPRPILGKLLEPHPHVSIFSWMRPVSNGRTPLIKKPARVAFTHVKLRNQVFDCEAKSCRLQNFFATTSWSICLSSIRSATRRFNLAISSSCCLSLRSSVTPSPAY